MNKCVSCGINISNKDYIGLNKKLIHRQIKNFYCIDCLADYLGLTKEELIERIEEFREQGCKLF